MLIAEMKSTISKIEKLSEADQRSLNKSILSELQFDHTLRATRDKLTKLADEALEEHGKGLTEEMI